MRRHDTFLTALSLSFCAATAYAQAGVPIMPAQPVMPAPPPPAAPPAPAPGAPATGQPIMPTQAAPQQPQQPQQQPAPVGGHAISVAPSPAQSQQPRTMRPPEGQLYDDGSGEPPFYEPLAAERLTLPPPPEPPPPPPPPSLNLSLTAFSETYSFVGNVTGVTTEVGVRIGPRGIVAQVGYLPGPGEFALGFQVLRYFGVRIWEPADGVKLSFLAPGLAAQVVTDFGDDIMGVVEMSGPGFGLSSCGTTTFPFLVQARVPNVALWLPFQAAGAGLTSGVVEPTLSWGFTLEAGLLFY